MTHASFRDKGIEFIKQAVDEDTAGNHAKAYAAYKNGLEYFNTYLRYEKNEKLRDMIKAKFKEYLERAEEVKKMLGACALGAGGAGGAPPPPPPAAVCIAAGRPGRAQQCGRHLQPLFLSHTPAAARSRHPPNPQTNQPTSAQTRRRRTPTRPGPPPPRRRRS